MNNRQNDRSGLVPTTRSTLARRELPLCEWPPIDRARWLRAQVKEDPFDSLGTLADLSPNTIDSFTRGYGRFLEWLASTGELDPEEPLEERITPGRVGRYIQVRRSLCRASTVDLDLQFLNSACRAMAPSADWTWIRRHPLSPTAAEIRASRKPIKDADPVATTAQGRRMMDVARESQTGAPFSATGTGSCSFSKRYLP